jgi:methionyl-tRNA formyltransferase
MDASFDTGPLLAQGSASLAEVETAADVNERLRDLGTDVLPRALARVELGDPGEPQSEGGASHAPFFEASYVEVDWSRPAAAIHAQVRAWWMAPPTDGRKGALAALDGEVVRLRRTRLDGAQGGIEVACGDGPLWVLETEAPDAA